MLFDALLWLHSQLRWIIILLLLVNIARCFANKNKPYTKEDRGWNLRLVIATHLTLVIGLIQYFLKSPKHLTGLALVKEYGMKEVMTNSVHRFWVVEHALGMIIAIVLITITSSISKKAAADEVKKHNKLFWIYLVALILILASIPWNFRFNDVPWFRTSF